ncbi:MAG: radical SAM protein [Sulfuricella sp.]|nr:radical SAM protein [Sulfuricella sp.]
MSKMLNIYDHDRGSAGMTYVYPVISRRAGGVSVGINLNTNNSCNWRCIYCQVPDLKRGSAPEVDLEKLAGELRGFLRELLQGDFMQRRVPAEARRLNDIALSGNGEPTSAREFAQVIDLIGEIMAEFGLIGKIGLVLITNGSLIPRAKVKEGLRKMARLGGEVWFKLDSATANGMRRINSTRQTVGKMHDNLRTAALLCPTWLQTCVFEFDGQLPTDAEREAYLKFIGRLQAEEVPLRGVLLYGLARPSMQPEAARLSALPQEWMLNLAAEIEAQGVAVKLNCQ